MPIEIREMVVKATVNADSEKPGKARGRGARKKKEDRLNSQAIFQEVADMMNRKKER